MSERDSETDSIATTRPNPSPQEPQEKGAGQAHPYNRKTTTRKRHRFTIHNPFKRDGLQYDAYRDDAYVILTRPKRKFFASLFIVLYACSLLLCLTSLIAPALQPHKPTVTSTITYSHEFLTKVAHYQSTSDAVSSFKARGSKFYTKVYANHSHDVVAVVTQEQRQNLLDDCNTSLKTSLSALKGRHTITKYQVGGDQRTLSAWIDRVTMTETLEKIPVLYGYIYYANGYTGSWDMTVKLYDASNGALWKQYNATDDNPLGNA